MTDLDRLLKLQPMASKGILPQGYAEEYNTLKSKIEQDLENHTKGVEYHKLAYEKVKQLEQQVVSLKETNKELRVQLHNSTQSLKDEIKQLKEQRNFLQNNLVDKTQKLEQIEDWYSRIQGKVSHDEALEMIEILRGKEETKE